jgi:nucleotide-binding universal stress UspA family protein
MDEFESVFKSTLKPTVTVDPMPLTRLMVVLDAQGCSAKREALIDCSVDLAERQRLEVFLVAPCRGHQGVTQHEEVHSLLMEVSERLARGGVQKVHTEMENRPPHTVILQAVERCQPSLLVMSSLFGENDEDLEHYTLGSTADRVLSSVRTPVLLIEGTVSEPLHLWNDLLIYVEDVDRSSQCLAATRALAVKNAATHLLHVIDDLWLCQLRQAIELAAEVPAEATEGALLRSLRVRMTHYLEAAGQLLKNTGHQSSSAILQGDPVEVTREQIRSRDPGLLVCNSVAPDHKLIDSLAYNLAAYVREVPLLLC